MIYIWTFFHFHKGLSFYNKICHVLFVERNKETKKKEKYKSDSMCWVFKEREKQLRCIKKGTTERERKKNVGKKGKIERKRKRNV